MSAQDTCFQLVNSKMEMRGINILKQIALYNLIQEAKSKNKAVQLFPKKPSRDFEIFIEPHHKVVNLPENVIRVDDCLVDLDFIVCALMIPNHKDRAKEYDKIRNELREYKNKNPYESNPRGRRNRHVGEMYPLKPEGIDR